MTSEALYFDPWIGPDYAQLQDELSKDVLSATVQALPFHFLGESHYGEAHEYRPEFTHYVIEKCGYAPSRCSRFFAHVLQIATGRPVNTLNRREQWRKIAYSNYIQDLLPQSRKAPNEAEWERGKGAFFHQLLITRPPVLVVLGHRLWERLPTESAVDVGPILPMDRQLEINDVRAYIYADDGAKRVTLAVRVKHPSGRGFDWRDAHKRAFTTALYYSNICTSDAVDEYEILS